MASKSFIFHLLNTERLRLLNQNRMQQGIPNAAQMNPYKNRLNIRYNH